MTNPPLAPNERTALLDLLFRRISTMDDSSLRALHQLTIEVRPGQRIQLPPRSTPFTPPPPPPQRPPINKPSGIGRRNFLLGLFMGGSATICAAAAAGVAFYDQTLRDLLLQQGVLPSLTPLPPTSTASPTLSPTPPTELVDQIAYLQSIVAGLTAERDDLKVRLGATETNLNNANREIGRLNGENSVLMTERDTLRIKVDGLTADLSAAQNKVTALETAAQQNIKLIGLYNRLEAADLDSTVKTGLSEVDDSLVSLNNSQTAAAQDATAIKNDLRVIDNQMVTLNASVDWLDREVATLTANFRAYQTALSNVQPNVDVAESTNRFAADVATAMTFSSEESRVAVQAMGALVARLPEFFNNVNQQTIAPVRTWIVPDQQGGLYKLLITPLRNGLLTSLQQLINSAENVKLIYNEKLAQPAQRVLEQRGRIRADIKQVAGASN